MPAIRRFERIAGLASVWRDLHLALRAGKPGLLRARVARSLPIHRAVHNLPHVGEPPLRSCFSLLPPCQTGELYTAETEFHLLICHNWPFYFLGQRSGEGWTTAVQVGIIPGVCISRKCSPYAYTDLLVVTKPCSSR